MRPLARIKQLGGLDGELAAALVSRREVELHPRSIRAKSRGSIVGASRPNRGPPEAIDADALAAISSRLRADSGLAPRTSFARCA